MKKIHANSLSLYAAHMLVVLAAYFPWFLNAESPTIVGRPLLVASVGVFLLASVLLRAALGHRLSSQALVGWVAVDFAVWMLGQVECLWSVNTSYVGLILTAMMAIAAWRHRRGVIHWAVVSLLAAHDLCVFRTVQEGLTNAFRHGKANRVRVRLDYSSTDVNVVVEDDGIGAAVAKPGVGLIGMRERAGALGGQLAAGPAATGGFVLQLTLPMTVEVATP